MFGFSHYAGDLAETSKGGTNVIAPLANMATFDNLGHAMRENVAWGPRR